MGVSLAISNYFAGTGSGSNVLLDASSPPKIKLCDFGLSKLWQQMEDLNTHTAVGTPAYMVRAAAGIGCGPAD